MARGSANGATDPKSAPWAALKVEQRQRSALKPFERNARTHSPEQVAEVAASMRKFGWTMPILVGEDDNVIAGHARLMAAETLGFDTVPVLVARGWSEEQTRSYIIADNKLALNSGWDWDLLALEVGDLRDMGADLAVIGFSELEVANLLAEPTAAHKALAASDPAEDSTWPTLQVKMPPQEFDKLGAAIEAVAGDLPTWRRLMLLVFPNG
jgi:ParB-like chromosome segregation protein Spo0J